MLGAEKSWQTGSPKRAKKFQIVRKLLALLAGGSLFAIIKPANIVVPYSKKYSPAKLEISCDVSHSSTPINFNNHCFNKWSRFIVVE